MLKSFKNPPAEYRVTPLWLWHGKINQNEIERQIREMHAKGVGGFVIHEPPGPRDECTLEEWTQYVEHACSIAEELGMRVHRSLHSSTTHAGTQTEAIADGFDSCDWALSMEDLKRMVDRRASLGVDFLRPHVFHYSIAGVRTAGAPPSQFYQATYWPYYRLFADYTARLSYVLSQGSRRAQIALLRPTEQSRSEGAPDTHRSIQTLIADYFDVYCTCLRKEHLDYDIVDDESIKNATAIDQRLHIEGEGYELLIFPPTTALGYEASLKIKEFVDDGGKVMATVLLPLEDAGGDRHEEVEQLFSGLFGKRPGQLRKNVISGILPRQPCLDTIDGNAFFFEAEEPDLLVSTLRANVSQAIKPKVSVRLNGAECHDITFLRRTTDGADLFFLANAAPEPREVQISIRSEGAPHMLDPETGYITALPNCTQQGSRTVLLHRFERFGSLLLACTDEPALDVAPPFVEDSLEVALSDEWGFELEQRNCIRLYPWELCLVQQQGQVRRDYSTSFEAACEPEDLLLVLDDTPEVSHDAGCADWSWSVFVNEKEAVEKAPWVVDVNFRCMDVTSLVTRGVNTLRVAITPGKSSCHSQLVLSEPRLMGSFSLDETHTRLLPPRKTIRTGSWTEQGYPFYSGTAVYRQTAHIPSFLPGQRVVIEAEKPADTVAFAINGAPVGVRPWAPFQVDITDLAKPGPNLLELRVTNSLANALLSEARPSGLLKGARIIIS